MACMMEDPTFKKMGRAMSNPTGQMLAKPISMLVNPFTVSQIGLAFNTLKGALTDPACKVKALSEVKTGDHIVLRPKKANLVDRMMMGQHAIVQGVNRDKNTILIIHYHSEVFKKKSNSQRLHVKSLVTGKIIQSKIRFNKDFDVYKINHDSSYTVQMVLERARARLGEKDFNFFLNNDEHFAYFCKTGTPRSCRNKMYIVRMAQFTVKLYCLGQSIYLMLGLNSGVATYFYRRTTRVKTHTKKETAIKAKEMATAGVFYGFLNNWLLIRSTAAPIREVDTKDDVLQDGNALQVAIPAPIPPRCRRRRLHPKFKPQPGEDRQKVMELGSQLVVRAVGQTVVKSVAKTGARHMAKEAMKKGIQSAAKKAGEKVAHHAGKSALHHAAKGAAVKTAVASAGKSSGHGVAGALRAAARGQGLAIGMGALVSVGFATKDIMRAKKDITEGTISADEYNTVVTRKVAGATTDIAMGTYGAVMGTLLAGPLGAVVGGFMGSMVGSMVGEEIGEELDKNNMGLKWAANEGTRQENMRLAKITEVADTSELQKEHLGISEYPQKEKEYPQKENVEELNALKSESTLYETDANEKHPDVLECKMQEELKPSTHRTDNDALQAAVAQGEDRNPEVQEPQLGELFGEYFDSIFNRKKTKEKENNVEGEEQEGQSYKFARGLWGSFFGNTEDEEEEEIIAGDQSIDRSSNVKDAIQGTNLESDKVDSTGGLNQIHAIITSMPEVNQILPAEPGSERAKTENICLVVNSLYNELNAECPPEKLATKTLEVDNSHDVDQSDSLMDKLESSPVTESKGTNADDIEECESKSVPPGTNVAESASQDKQQATAFSFFGFGKTTFGKVIHSIVQDIVSGDDYHDTDNDTERQSCGRDPLEDVDASRSGNGEGSNEAKKAEDIQENKTAAHTIKGKASDGKTLEGSGEPEDGNDEEMRNDGTEGDDSCDNGDVVTSDTDGEDSSSTMPVTADVHNKQIITEDTGMEESPTTEDMLRDPNENTDEKADKDGIICSKGIDSRNDTVTVDTSIGNSDDIIMAETTTTDWMLRDTTEKRGEENDGKCPKGSVSRDDTVPGHSPIEDNDVGDIAMGARITTQQLSTDVIITIEKEEDEPNVEETEPKVEETEPKVEETEPKVEETELKVEETEPNVEESEPKVEETEPKVEETEPKVEETEPKVEETEPEDEESNITCSVGECEPETHYMVDSDHILPRNNITDYYSITWSVEAEDTGEVIETGLIEDEMTIRNILKEFAQTAPNCSDSNLKLDCNLNIGGSYEAENNMLQKGNISEDNGVSNSHDSQNKDNRPTRQVGIKEKAD